MLPSNRLKSPHQRRRAGRSRRAQSARAVARTRQGRLRPVLRRGRKAPPVIDILIISGGGDWGAFGAGFLKGWQKVPAQHPLAKPEFDAVTGVNTDALIARFAFLGGRGLCCVHPGGLVSPGVFKKETMNKLADLGKTA